MPESASNEALSEFISGATAGNPVFPPDILANASRLIEILRGSRRKVTTAESCTGGLLAGAITAIAGSSDVFERGFVTYANRAKVEMIGVAADLIDRRGAVSNEVARAMAEGALAAAGADLAAAITGIAGPGGGTVAKPVGLVFIGIMSRNGPGIVHRFEFGDIGREGIRIASVRSALELLLGVAET